MDQYGKPLEAEHKGEYVAIGNNGQVILSRRAGEVLQKAMESFGRGNFGLFRIGHKAFVQWLKIKK